MERFAEMDPETLTREQRRIWDEIATGPRRSVPAPLQIWLKSPELAARAQKLGEYARYRSSLPPRLSELAILVTARQWTAQFEWHHHERFALEAGLGTDVIAAIRERRPPPFAAEDERVVHDFATVLYRDRKVDDATFARALDILGERGVVDLVAVLGYYAFISMTLNVFEVPVPEPKPLAD